MADFTRFFSTTLVFFSLSQALPAQTWHLLFIRHAEKPTQGLGQLNCTGLQRSLHLADALLKLSAPPQLLIAPNPGIYKMDSGHSYAYIRPLATLEPSAIRFGLPIEADLGYNNVQGLAQRLKQLPDNSVVWIVWEHHYLVDTERQLLQWWHQSLKIPDWPDGEYNRVDMLDVRSTAAGWHVRYRQENEHLNPPNTCMLGKYSATPFLR